MFDAANILGNIKKYFESKLAFYYETIKTTNLGLYTYYILNWYVKVSEKAKKQYKHLYDNNPIIKSGIDNFVYGTRYVFAISNNQKIEPITSNWICSSLLLSRDPNKFVGDAFYYKDTYDFLKPMTEPADLYNECFVETTNAMNNIVSSNSEGMVTLKVENKYANQVFLKPRPVTMSAVLPLVPSPHFFLSIKYTHPLMKTSIYIDLDKGYYNVNNEILSPLFIKRYLEHQPLNYHFDLDYVVEILDNNVQTVELRSSQYVLLGNSEYVVVTQE
jgi:hypothetical protein